MPDKGHFSKKASWAIVRLPGADAGQAFDSCWEIFGGRTRHLSVAPLDDGTLLVLLHKSDQIETLVNHGEM